MSLKDFLKDTLQLGKDDLFKVDVKESFSFFNTEAALKDQILETFTDFKIKGRFVNVEVSNSPEGGGRRRDSRGPRKSKDSRDSRDRDRGRGKKGEGSFSKSGSRRSGSKQGSSSGNRRSKKRDGFY